MAATLFNRSNSAAAIKPGSMHRDTQIQIRRIDMPLITRKQA